MGLSGADHQGTPLVVIWFLGFCWVTIPVPNLKPNGGFVWVLGNETDSSQVSWSFGNTNHVPCLPITPGWLWIRFTFGCVSKWLSPENGPALPLQKMAHQFCSTLILVTISSHVSLNEITRTFFSASVGSVQSCSTQVCTWIVTTPYTAERTPPNCHL